MYSYHYIYDYLFVQVTEELFERDYARRIRTSPNFNTADRREQTPESKSKASDGFNQADDHLLGRFRKTSTDNSHENGDYIANENTFESSDCGLQRKQDVKIQKHNVMSALQKVMQST